MASETDAPWLRAGRNGASDRFSFRVTAPRACRCSSFASSVSARLIGFNSATEAPSSSNNKRSALTDLLPRLTLFYAYRWRGSRGPRSGETTHNGPRRVSACRALAQLTIHQQQLTRSRFRDGWSDPRRFHGLAPTRPRALPRLPHNSRPTDRYVSSPKTASSWL